MSKLTKSWLDKKKQPFDSWMLKTGEMMEVSDPLWPDDNGIIVIKNQCGTISLSDGKFWTSSRIRGRKLQPGESITLTQE